MKHLKKTYILVMMALVLSHFAFSQNLVQNGDFEQTSQTIPSSPTGQEFESFSSSTLPNLLTSWAPINANIMEVHHRLHRNIGGEANHHVDLNGLVVTNPTVTGISQNVNLIAGVNYQLSFLVSVHPALNPGTNATAEVTIINSGAGDIALNEPINQVDVTSSAWASNGWNTITFNFIPTAGGVYTLTFSGQNSSHGFGGVLIDDVQLAASCYESIILDIIDHNTVGYKITENNVDIQGIVWKIDGEIVSSGDGLGSFKYIDLEPGTYEICAYYFGPSLTVEGEICCMEICDSITLAVISQSPPSQEETGFNPTLPFDLELTPNPANDKVEIKLNNLKHSFSYDREWNVVVFDSQGKEIYQTTLQKGNRSLNINIASLSGGTYFVKVSNDEDFVYKKFIKHN